MRLKTIVLLCTINTIIQKCFGLKYMDLPGASSDEQVDRFHSRKRINRNLEPYRRNYKNGQSSRTQFEYKRSTPYSGGATLYNKKRQDIWRNNDDVPSNTQRIRRINHETWLTNHRMRPSNKELHPKNNEYVKQNDHHTWSSNENDNPMTRDVEKKEHNQIKNYFRSKVPDEESDELGPNIPVLRSSDDSDKTLKSKIALLVQQTMHDTKKKVDAIQEVKLKFQKQPAYEIGFLLSKVKKSRDILDELFNVAVKHREHWKALEQLKIFELIMHTNLDTSIWVKQIVEIHVKTLNDQNNPGRSGLTGKRIVIL